MKKNKKPNKELNHEQVNISDFPGEIKFENVQLVRSKLEPITEKPDLPVLTVHVHSYMKKEYAYSQLYVTVSYLFKESENENNGIYGYLHEFMMVGEFNVEGEISDEAFRGFLKFNSLPFLWPYARQFATDIMGRTGISFNYLPIINIQDMLDDLENTNLVVVEKIEDDY